jgi:predicted alpha/beta-hydrolase family hydrolase
MTKQRAIRVRVRTVPTSQGEARAYLFGAASDLTVVLGHGAGGGVEAADLQACARAIARSGRQAILVEQPWRVAGRGVAPRPQTLDLAWLDVLAALDRPRVIVGGRSAGARVACRTGGMVDAEGVIALAFPLHPPGRPERSRGAELVGTGLPTLVVQGTRDAFGTADEVARAAPSVLVLPLQGADHALRCGRDATLTDVRLAEAVASMLEFLDGFRE